MYRIFITISVCVLIFHSCKDSKQNTPNVLFANSIKLSECNFSINNDDLARIEGLQSNDSKLITLDYHSGKSFTLFDNNSGKAIGRFGKTGQGPNEIPLGTYGYIEKDNFFISSDEIGYIAKYNIDSLSKNIDLDPVQLTRYKIPEAQFSRIIPIDDSLFLGAGTYGSEFQYLLFDKSSNILDYNIEIYNAHDIAINKYHKFLSNQGILRKRPNKKQFVYSIDYSSNIDFFEIKNNKILLTKSLRLKDPIYTAIQDNNLNRVIPANDNVIGYLDISTTENYVYALYTDKKIKENDTYNDFNSNIILIFDWDGQPIKKYELPNEVYYITINEKLKRIYAALLNEDQGWTIKCYELMHKSSIKW